VEIQPQWVVTPEKQTNKHESNIKGAALCTVISSAQFSQLNRSITPGNHQRKGAAPLFIRRGVQMIIGVYEFLSNVNKSSVNISKMKILVNDAL
jgi:hypothetical protein